MNEPLKKTKSPWRWLRRILLVLAIIATSIGIFYTEEDVRGKMEWDHYRHQLEAKGENLDWRSLAPSSVPQDQNFFTAPIFTNLLVNHFTLNIYREDGSFPKFPENTGQSERQITDLRAWQTYYRSAGNEFPVAAQSQSPAADVLLALSKSDSALKELREAIQRPYAEIPLNYSDGFSTGSQLIPYLTILKRCSQFLQLRAVADLADNRNTEAFADTTLLLQLNDSLRDQPFLISHLVRIAILQITLQPIWEGTINHEWSDQQLAEIDSQLANLDFLADYQFAMRGERICAIQDFENQRVTRKYEYVDTEGKINTVRYTFLPTAFFYQNELNIARLDQDWALPLVNTNTHTASPEKLKEANRYVQSQLGLLTPYKTMSFSTFSAVGNSVRRFAFAQASVDLARVACALERYHLAHGQYPDTLDALAPQYLDKIPNDVIGGQPLHYQLTPGGKFLLYSIGWNEKDASGQMGLNKQGHLDITQGDWVWPATAK